MGNNKQNKQTILGRISGIFLEFNKLAQLYGISAASLQAQTPSYARAKSAAGNDQEGLLGSIILEQFLSPVFTALAHDMALDASGGTISGAITTIDMIQADRTKAAEQTRGATDDARFKKGAGKGSEALLFSPAKSSGILAKIEDGGHGFFTSPFNSRAHKRLESALVQASAELMNLEKFEAKFA